MATEILSQRGIKTNVTACMTPYQALQAAEAGGTYVSLFANRMLDGHVLTLAGGKLKHKKDATAPKQTSATNKTKLLPVIKLSITKPNKEINTWPPAKPSIPSW